MAKKIQRSDIFKSGDIEDLINEVVELKEKSLDSYVQLVATEKKLKNFLSHLNTFNDGEENQE